MSNKILTLQTEGTSLAPRYSIMDEQGFYYNEEDGSWVDVTDENDPSTLSNKRDRPQYTLYCSPNVGCTKIQELLLKSFENLPTKSYVAPFILKL